MLDQGPKLLKYKDIVELRNKLLIEQNYICPICNTIIDSDPVLDHSHDTGFVRAVKHRSCNQSEGLVLRAFKCSMSNNMDEFLDNMKIFYNKDYSSNPQHPTHKKKLIAIFSKKSKEEQIKLIKNKDLQNTKLTKATLVAEYKKELKNK